ncbi:MAG TPA: rhamnogalacturonan lyase [Polyangiaceae bacterium]
MIVKTLSRKLSTLSLGGLATAGIAIACSSTEGGNGDSGVGHGGSVATGGTASGASGSAGASSGGTSGATGGASTGGASGSAGVGLGGAAGSPAGGTAGSGAGGAAGASSGGVAGDAGAASGGAGLGGGGSGTGGTGGSAGGTAGAGGGGKGVLRVERLDRGVVAVVVSGGVYVGWRMFGYEYDSANAARISYNVYRNGTLAGNVTNSTNYQDAGGNAQSMYTVRAVIDGVEGAASAPATPWAQNYLRVPLMPPSSSYAANDASVGDADGDGIYEIYLKWDPSDAKDNSQAGVTSNVFIDCLKLDGTRLFRLDLGPNIRAGAHYTQHVVQDLDGDGKAEIALKTAPGTRDGTGAYLKLGPAANDTDSMVYRNSDGYVLTGPEYLTVFNGQTGAELATVSFDVARGTVSSWGDSYGNRVDRFLSTAAYLDSTGLPSFIMARGYYTRTTLTAWNFRGGQLTQLWKFDSGVTPRDAMNRSYTGQGAHSMTVVNADSDPQQEIVYGAMMIDHTGMGLCSTGNNHGDALHAGDHVPSRPGMEVFMCNEDGSKAAHYVYDARTCAIIQAAPVNGADTGRCVAGDVSPSNPGSEMWSSSVTGLFSATTNTNVGTKPSQTNFLVYWDADESREIEDGTTISKFGGGTLQTCSQCASNNGTKSTPTLTADLVGDWREEIIWRESNNTGLRLYTTTNVTTRRIYTLMHDPQYRMQVSAQQTAYNQPPHPGFHIGNGMAAPPNPDIHAR